MRPLFHRVLPRFVSAHPRAARSATSAGLGLALAAGLAAPGAAQFCEQVRINGQFQDVITYCATSVLPPQAGNTYVPSNLGVLGPADQAWCEGRPGHGVGEEITLQFGHPALFRTVIIEPGYQKNRTSFQANGRPRQVTLRTEGGVWMRAELQDRMGTQRLVLPQPVEALWLSLTIDSVYPGSRWADTCISYLGPDLEEMNYR